MKRQEKNPGSYVAFVVKIPSSNGAKVSIAVGIKGVEGTFIVDWDFQEPKGPYYSAAKKVARDRGFTDVKEVGTLQGGRGFIFEPVLKKD